MIKEIEIGKLNDIFQKYGDLEFQVDTPYGFHDIEWCGITEENAEVYKCELENGAYVEGADYHRLKKEDGDFTVLKNIEIGTPIQVRDGISNVKSIKLLDERDTLYDVQVSEVHQYYSNDIVSHNTVFTVDAIKFLLFGKTTKTDKNEQIFNTFTDKDELTVRGMIEVEGNEMIIERKLNRRPKRGGKGWNTTNKVNYYELLPDGEEVLLNDEDAKKTGDVIKKNIGSEKDFDITILTTARNLEDLIDAKPTESGRLLTRFIGLEVIEAKEQIAKDMNSEFNKLKKGNHYDVTTLLNDNETLEENIGLYEKEVVEYTKKLDASEKTIQRLEDEKERLINSKLKIDSEVSDLNPEKLEGDIDTITKKGVTYKNKIEEFKTNIAEIKDVNYDEYKYDKLTKEDRDISIKIGSYKNDIMSFGKVIDNLRDSEICETCKRPLDDVDNSETIKEYEEKIESLKNDLTKKENKLARVQKSITKIKENRDVVDRRDRLELECDKAEVEIGALRNKIVSKKADLKKYKNNEDAIKTNITIESNVSSVKTNLVVENNTKSEINQSIFTTKQNIKSAKEVLTKNLKMIKTLKREEEVEKIFKIYLQLVGKKGISKLVLRSVLPIINSEIQRLLDDVCDFDVELVMTNKNDVEYHIIKNDVTKLLKSGSGLERTISSLALRCVLSKISHLPKPNFITFDEVLGKLASDNIEKVRPMFEKIKGMFDIVFFITHNDLVKDWSDKVITVKKVDNISSIKL
jgi:DNA repair exonuclease SbcCD ATPase subunit